MTTNLQNTWNVKHCFKHFTYLFNAYRNPSEINTVIHPILYLGNWRHRKLNNLRTAACLLTRRAGSGYGLMASSVVGSLAVGSVCCSHSVKKHPFFLAPTHDMRAERLDLDCVPHSCIPDALLRCSLLQSLFVVNQF